MPSAVVLLLVTVGDFKWLCKCIASHSIYARLEILHPTCCMSCCCLMKVLVNSASVARWGVQGVMLDIVSMLFTLLRAYVPAEFRWSLLMDFYDMFSWNICMCTIVYCVFFALA